MPSEPQEILSEEEPLPEWVVPYVAALVDTNTSIVVTVSQAANRPLGYQPKQEIRYKTDKPAVIKCLQRYCAEQDISPHINKKSGTTHPRYRFTVSARDAVVAFLDPLRPYLLLQEQAVSLLLDTLIPGLNAGVHTDPESFIGWAAYLDEYRDAFGRANQSKYDYDYFCAEFDVAHSEIDPGSFEWAANRFGDSSRTTEEYSRNDAVDWIREANVGCEAIHTDWFPAYIGALIDTHSKIVMSINDQQTASSIPDITHQLHYNAEGAAICRLLTAYCKDNNIEMSVRERTDTTYDRYTLTVETRRGLETLLGAIQPYLLSRQSAAQLLVEKVIPALDPEADDAHSQISEAVGILELLNWSR